MSTDPKELLALTRDSDPAMPGVIRFTPNGIELDGNLRIESTCGDVQLAFDHNGIYRADA